MVVRERWLALVPMFAALRESAGGPTRPIAAVLTYLRSNRTKPRNKKKSERPKKRSLAGQLSRHFQHGDDCD
jgi:hypothetical protein